MPRLVAIGALAMVGVGAHAQKAEVIHWWTSGGESAAVKELVSAYTKAGGTWVDAAVAGGANARAAAINRIVGGNPSTAAQFVTSKQYRDIIEEGLLNDIDAVAIKDGWETWLPTPILQSIKVNGHFYAVPVNIHNPAWFWYSKSALQKAGVAAEPRTLDELFSALDKLKAVGLMPLAFGGQGWQEYLTFNAVLLHVGGKETYTSFYRDRDLATVNGPAFRKVLETMRRLKGYTDPGSPGRNWNDATALLISGKAGFQIMGDWAKGEFHNAKQVAGKEYGCFNGFGKGAPYMISGDVFVFPKTSDKSTIEAQRKLATVFTAPATQIAFNNKKGSIPIRTDVDATEMDACARIGIEAMKDRSRQIGDPQTMITPDKAGAVQDVLTKFWNSSQSIDDAVKAFARAING